MSKILIDADILVYRALSSVEREVHWGDDVWCMYTDLSDAHEALDGMITGIVGSHKTNYTLCFSDKRNFRKAVDPTYKSNRKDTRKPMGFVEFRLKVIEMYPSMIKLGIEADDTIGILATKPNTDFIIYSGDKDLKQIPGKHLSGGTLHEITQEEADLFFYTQVLTGDAADGYPGCPGIGAVKAAKILGDAPSWEKVVLTYEKAGLTEDDALRQARLARILRWTDWDQDQQEPILWKPETPTASSTQACANEASAA